MVFKYEKKALKKYKQFLFYILPEAIWVTWVPVPHINEMLVKLFNPSAS